MKEVGLPPRALEDADLKVPALAVGRLLELAAARGGEPAFGLRTAESRRLSNLGYLGMLARDEPTLRSALEALMQNICLHTDALALRLERVGELVSLREELVTEDGESLRQLMELIVASTYAHRATSMPKELPGEFRLRGQEQFPGRFSDCYSVGPLHDAPLVTLGIKTG